ncbi:hypothetical protein VXS06_19015 [Photobacterium toruni]|uniref:Uncharacterized protein n=1 Tax=Photobacterium toruni TaxID=1935446 RepID=A0ABU6LCM8_9GAMM|nr:hypothetical protein [Photobacterium toruni]
MSGKLKRIMSNDRSLVRDKIKKESQVILFRNKHRVIFELEKKEFFKKHLNNTGAHK